MDYLLTAKPEFKEYINRGFVAAARRSNIDVMKYLISKGANAHTKSNEIIEEAAKEGRYSVVAYLLTLYDEERIGKLKLRKPIGKAFPNLRLNGWSATISNEISCPG